MNLTLDAYAHRDSPLHRWEPRCKLVALLGLLFAFAFVRDLWLLPAMLLVTAGLYAASRLPAALLFSRLRYPGMFLLLFALLVPLVVGSTVLLQVGPLALHREGLLFLLLIVTRFTSILTVGIVLFGTTPFLTSVRALRALGLPEILADMTLLTYRYLHELGRDLRTMQTAMRLRGFQRHTLSPRNLRMLAALVGSLLVRSYARSERVYQAMILRGYGHASARCTSMMVPVARSDLLALVCTLLVAAGFVVGDMLLRAGVLV
jgi:cobalt/nickel transport system permease protein